jgi:hypothetical protein
MPREEIAAFSARRLNALARHDWAALASDHAESGVAESPWAGTMSGRAAIEQAYAGAERRAEGEAGVTRVQHESED